MAMDVHYSSRSAEHYSPSSIIDAARACLGSIDLDPCAETRENPNVPATLHYTVADDGLARQWHGRVYMNPPYGRAISSWSQKLVLEYREGRCLSAIALVPARTDTRWWRTLSHQADQVCLVSGRLKFGTATNSAPFPSAVFYFRPGSTHSKPYNPFVKSFGHLGQIWQLIAG